jgi:glycosyltransferase involved in cell wall biosynthesis
MKIALITDAWRPQINGVVTTLIELVEHLREQGHIVEVIHPGMFDTRPCPGYAGIDLAIRPYAGVAQRLKKFAPQAIHVATEGPMGWAARHYCLRNKLAFSTAYHTRFPEILKAALRIPLWIGYALFRHFHRPSSSVMVPTQGVLRLLEGKGFRKLHSWTHGVDTQLFAFSPQARNHELLSDLKRPIALYVGRVSYEKNIDAFLDMPWHGSKVVCGVGPLERELKSRYDDVKWLGVLRRDVLAGVYAAADVFTFPSRNETFGLVMLEAMACGTPVAAYPVDGPLEVLPMSLELTGQRRGGVLSEDLAQASLDALRLPRTEARLQALDFSWQEATRLFVDNLVPIPTKPVFLANHLSDPVFERFLAEAGRLGEYQQIKHELIPSLLAKVESSEARDDLVLSMANDFTHTVPRLRLSCRTSARNWTIDIGFPTRAKQFLLSDGQNSVMLYGLDELLEKVSDSIGRQKD